MGLQNAILTSLDNQHPDNLRNALLLFSHSGPDNLELPKQLCGDAISDLNDMILKIQTLKIKVKPWNQQKPTEKVFLVTCSSSFWSLANRCFSRENSIFCRVNSALSF